MSSEDPEWSKRVDFDAFNTIDELIEHIDSEIQLLRPLHLRRMNLIKVSHSKGESCSNLLTLLKAGGAHCARQLLEGSPLQNINSYYIVFWGDF